VSVLSKGSATTRLARIGKTRISSQFKGTYRCFWKDGVIERTTRPPETPLKVAAAYGLLVLVIQHIRLVSSHARGAHEVSELRTVLLELWQ
jgi:hypothetical protein